jgi:hypothetical protein
MVRHCRPLLILCLLVLVITLACCTTPSASPTPSIPQTTPLPATTVTSETTTASPPVTTPTITSKTYYVKNGGNDSASGLSDAEAWATLSKVQNSQFNPGDAILLKCGSTWDERLEFPSSGNSSNDILFSSYGSGDQPKMMRLHLSQKEYITVSNIHMLADKGEQEQALLVEHCNNITIDGVTNDGQKMMDNDRYRVTKFEYSYNIVIRNSTIKDGGNHIGTPEWGGGLGIDRGNHDFLVENNLVYNHAEFCIQTCAYDQSVWVYNITIRGNTIYNEEGYYDDCRGINVGCHSYNVTIEKNTISNMPTFLIGTDADEHDAIIRNNLLFYTLDSGYATFIDILSMSLGEHHNSYVYNNSMFHLSHIAEGSFFYIRTIDSVPNTGHRIFNNLCVTYNPDVVFINDQRWDAGNPNPLPGEFTSDYNLFYCMVPSGHFTYRNVKYDNIEDWREASGQDMHSIYANPLLSGIENYDDSIAYTTAGNELISNPSFDYNIDGWGCWFDTAGGASGSISRTTAAGEYATSPGGLKVTCNTGGDVFSSIQLRNTSGMQIESNKWYVLSFKAKASSQFRMHDINFGQMVQPFTEYYSRKIGDSPIITTDWKTYYVFVYTSQAASDARITWYLGNALPDGGMFYLDDVSFKLADGLNNIILPDIEDFVTPPNSPCVDAGITLSDVIDDFLGNHRPQGAGYDIGAYECQ